ncbi:hypothetical protein [Rhodoligotrophos defluvii]|uniref:hypothetical protein n=1 Tax=Rhodoligotrophos defluvii TaxID=2561934 RepID=UPI00148542ED|nr:hypothetical protein [Rhodoligotrophos defluvii]
MGEWEEGILRSKAGALAIWEGWVFGPVAWAAHQNLSYGLTHLLCGTSTKWPIYLATLAAVGVAAAAGYFSWRLRQAASTVRFPEAHAVAASRARFITTVGVLICTLSAAGILVETIPVPVLDPCAGAT